MQDDIDDKEEKLHFFPEMSHDFKTDDEKEEIQQISNEILSLSKYKKDGGITYAITGDWGSGKTSYLRALKTELNDKDKDNNKTTKCATFFYEAWKYQNDNVEPIVSLLNLIAKTIDEREKNDSNLTTKITNSIYKISKAVVLGSTDILARTLSNNTVNIDYAKDLLENVENLEAQKYKVELSLVDKNDKQLEDLIELTKELYEVEKIVIFIDDVDRVIPKKAFDIIDSIRFYLRNIPDVIVIFGINSKVISKYVEKNYTLKDEEDESKHKYSIFSGEEFIEKLFDARESLESKNYTDVKSKYPFEELVEDENILKSLNNLPYRKWRLLFNALLKKYKLSNETKLSYIDIFHIILSECYPRLYFCIKEFFVAGKSTIKDMKEFFEDEGLQAKKDKLYKRLQEDKLNFAYLEFNIFTKEMTKYLCADEKTKEKKTKEENGK
jgi:hypothetical protein